MHDQKTGVNVPKPKRKNRKKSRGSKRKEDMEVNKIVEYCDKQESKCDDWSKEFDKEHLNRFYNVLYVMKFEQPSDDNMSGSEDEETHDPEDISFSAIEQSESYDWGIIDHDAKDFVDSVRDEYREVIIGKVDWLKNYQCKTYLNDKTQFRSNPFPVVKNKKELFDKVVDEMISQHIITKCDHSDFTSNCVQEGTEVVSIELLDIM